VFHSAGRSDVTDIRDAYELLSPLVGAAGASTLFALALLAAGLNATFTATLAGQVVMEGFLRIRIPAWQRRLFTRLLALIPALFAIGHGGDGSIGSLLVLSQVVLSVQLPFALLPLLHFAGSKRLMGAHVAPRWLAALAWLLCSVLIVLVLKLLIG
jgi:manganese transport protein